MEDSLENIDKQTEHIFLENLFNKMCPLFISIGMTYEQFWENDPTIAKCYLEAFNIKQKREQEIKEWNMWKVGVYMYEALCNVSPILHAFSKKGTKPLPFPDKPLGIEAYENEEKKEEIKKQKQENERLLAIIYFNNWAKTWQKKFESKEANSNGK